MVPLEHLDLVVKMADLEKGASREVKVPVGREDQQEHVYVCNAPNNIVK